MPERRTITAAVTILGLSLALLAASVAVHGCQAMRDLDEAIWKPTTTTTDSGETVVTPPPIVEIAAAIAAVMGFGGMSTWVARSNKRTANGYKDLAARVADLESRLRSEHDGG